MTATKKPLLITLVITVLSVSSAFVPHSARTLNPLSKTSFIRNYVAVPSCLAVKKQLSVLKMAETPEEVEQLREKARKLREEAAELSSDSAKKAEADAKAKKDADWADETEEEVVVPLVKPAQGGALYDDQVEEFKDPLSDSMRQRLMREAQTGMDAEKPQTNVILYISIVVAALVALGGKGLLY